ncbi:MAG: YfhO family protein [Verrucomicrobia bacterium]|nr:MAG: YfhO family protein [Verrucomicrobiota bacterium]
MDNVYIYGPIFSEVSRLASSGAVPYYLPDIGTGFPVFESPHFSILYPFYFFGLINYGGPLASLYTLTNLTLLHIFVFYVSLYVLLRCATITPWASYIGASVGMLARNTELYASWITITASYAWLPLVLAGGVLLLRFPGKARGILVFSIAAGLLALASASQSVIHTAMTCLMLFASGIAWTCLQRRFADVWRVAWSLAVCGGIAFGLAGAAILPMYIATGEMIRHIGAGAPVIGHARIPWESFNLNQLTLNQAIGVVVRPVWIAIVGSPYVGPLGLIGTLLTGIYFRRLDPILRMLAVAFGVISLYGLLSGFGTNLGLAYVNFHLPFVNRIREAGRHLVLFVIGVSFLSGLGYSLLARSLEQYKERRNARPLILPGVLVLIFAGIILWELFHKDNGRMQTGFWILALAPILFLLGRICRLSGYQKIVSAAVFVSAAAVVIPVRGISVLQSDFSKPMNLLSHKVIQSFAGRIDTSGYRVDFSGTAFSHRLWAMNASYYGVKSFYNQLTPQPYDQFRFSLMANVPHLRAMMGARYVLCGLSNSPTDSDAREILETEGYRLFENLKPMGRISLVHRVAGSANNEGEFINTIGKGFDYFSEAYVTLHDFDSTQYFLGSAQMLPHPRDRITKIVDQANRSYSAVESDSASLLVLNEWFTPAWKVRVNGKNQPTLRVNQWQTGVLLGAGKNRVEFEYRPTLFRVLMALNRITAVLLLIFVIFAVSRKSWWFASHFATIA